MKLEELQTAIDTGYRASDLLKELLEEMSQDHCGDKYCECILCLANKVEIKENEMKKIAHKYKKLIAYRITCGNKECRALNSVRTPDFSKPFKCKVCNTEGHLISE